MVNHSIIAGNRWSKQQRPTPPPTLAAIIQLRLPNPATPQQQAGQVQCSLPI
ncbi:hypothetical protein IMZ48_20370 [Candidatus Bathyarchaeota archaeon]|nr:hypothetical protein [Candidatus Bathyarchaeota archaeon]